ncbi:MAG: hypothetical protein LBT55_03890 [Clostridiaceae bacterium]|jgi:hypothetical protein|nr:hypothetical protein [Clostridiaceae bacterium]
MSALKVEYYKNFGRCVSLEGGGVHALITVDLGPRIIYFGDKRQNFLYEDTERKIVKNGDFFDKTYKSGEEWRLYGGHRIWKSPEDLYTYTPDNYPLRFELADGTAIFYPKATINGLKFTLKTEFLDDVFHITNSVENVGAEDAKIGLWALTVLAKGGELSVPLNTKDTGFLPNRNLVFWPYSDFTDPRFKLHKNSFTLKQTEREGAFKVGCRLDKSVVRYTLNGKTLELRADIEKIRSAPYPDMCCNFEAYTNEHIIESEWLTQSAILPTGASLTIKEEWQIIGETK